MTSSEKGGKVVSTTGYLFKYSDLDKTVENCDHEHGQGQGKVFAKLALPGPAGAGAGEEGDREGFCRPKKWLFGQNHPSGIWKRHNVRNTCICKASKTTKFVNLSSCGNFIFSFLSTRSPQSPSVII